MANSVVGAIGTEKQFSPQPKATYEKRLASLPARFDTSGIGSDGMQLARSLGVLGDTIAAAGVSGEKNKEKLGIAEAERIVSGRTEGDLKKLTAIEMLHNYGNFDVSDNPYAIATVEKMRGKYFGAKAKEDYMSQRSQQPPAKTADEEVQQFNQFVGQQYGQVANVSSDPAAFQKGFYDSNLANQIDVAHTRSQEIDLERKAILKGSTQAALGEITSSYASGGLKNSGGGPFTVPGVTPVEPGNIDIYNRPRVKNQDGSISTVRSMGVNIDGKEVLIPTVSDDGKILSLDEAVEQYRKTGKHLGVFASPEDSTKYAKALHNQQEAFYVDNQDPLLASVNKVFADTRLAGVSIPDRITWARDFLKDFAMQTGDYTKLDDMAKNITLGVDSTGKPVKIGDVTDLADYKKLAEQRRLHMFGEDVQKSLETLQGMSKEQANAQFEDWRQNKPEWYNTILPFRDNIYEAKIKEEQKAKIAAANQAAKAYGQRMALGILENQFKAFNAGNTKDASDNVVASDYSALPKFEYTTQDAAGNLVSKKYEWTQEQVSNYVDYKLKQIKSDPNATPEQISAATVKLLSWPPAKQYADTVKMQLNNAIDTLTPDRLQTDGKGNAVLSKQVDDAFMLHRSDPEAFLHVFGEEAARKVEALDILSQASGGDVKQGAAAYANARDNIKNDPEGWRKIKGDVQAKLAATKMDGFLGIDGTPETIDTTLPVNEAVFNRVRSLTEYLVAGGMSIDTATQYAIQKAKDTNYVYGNTAMPRTIFNGINTDNKAAVGKQVLDYYRAQYAQDAGIKPEDVLFQYDPDRQALRVYGGQHWQQPYTLNDIAYSGNVLLNGSAQPQGHNITLGDVQQAKKQDAQITSTAQDLQGSVDLNNLGD